MMKIVVVGSSNVDMIAQVAHLPAPGETVGGARFMQAFGGKGANQAVAAARLGGQVTFVTALGNDMYADSLREHFQKEGIATDCILSDQANPTGTALIFVADNAENCIAVAPGANGSLLPQSLQRLDEILQGAHIVLMQAEIPYQTILHVARAAKAQGVKVLFNPAPACAISDELMRLTDILVVNETEAEFISGVSFTGSNEAQIARALLAAGAGSVVVTLGSKGAWYAGPGGEFAVPAFKVEAVDTTAAGDVFCGALAVAAAGKDIDREALLFANAAAALAVTKMGAQPSIPYPGEVNDLLCCSPAEKCRA